MEHCLLQASSRLAVAQPEYIKLPSRTHVDMAVEDRGSRKSGEMRGQTGRSRFSTNPDLLEETGERPVNCTRISPSPHFQPYHLNPIPDHS